MNDEYKVVGEGPNPLLLPIKQDAWLRDHEEPGEPKANPKASYKTWHRLRIGGGGWDSDKWVLWIGVGDQIWPVTSFNIERWKKGGLVYGNMGKGHSEHYRGTAYSIALRTGLDDFTEYEEALNKAETFIMFAVSPEGVRTRVWVCVNDHWTNPRKPKPGETIKKPEKHRRAIVPPEGEDNAPLPEFYFEEEEPPLPPVEPPPVDPPPNNLDGVKITPNSAQDISGWKETSRIKRISVEDGRICIDHTKRGVWLGKVYASNGTGDLMEASPWVIATIDSERHGSTFEWMRDANGGQECKALGAKPPETTIATLLGDHIKHEPLASWVPQPGEWVQVMMSTVARNNEKPPTKECSDVVRFRWPAPGESIDIKFDKPQPKKPAAPTSMRASIGSWDRVLVEWVDNSDNETGFIMEMRHPKTGTAQTLNFEPTNVIGRPGPGMVRFSVVTDPETTYEFRVKATNTAGSSDYSNVARVRTPKKPVEPPPPPPKKAWWEILMEIIQNWLAT